MARFGNESGRLLDRPVDVVGLAFLVTLLRQVPGRDRGADFGLGDAVREGVDGVGEIDSVAVSGVLRLGTEMVDGLESAGGVGGGHSGI